MRMNKLNLYAHVLFLIICNTHVNASPLSYYDMLPPGSGYFWELAVDNNNVIWIRTDYSLWRIDETRTNPTSINFENYIEFQFDNIKDMFLASNNDLWVVVFEKVYKVEEDSLVFFENVQTACSIYVNNSDVWVGTEKNGLYRYSKYNVLLEHFPVSMDLPLENINTIRIDTDERLWVSTDEQGIYVYKEEVWTKITTDDGLISNNTTSLEIQGSTIWVTTDIGISYYDGSSWQSYQHDYPDDWETPVEFTSCFAGENEMLFSHTNGYVIYDGEEWVDGIWLDHPDVHTTSIIRDEDGIIWTTSLRNIMMTDQNKTDVENYSGPILFIITTHPNPFNPTTTISYSLPAHSHVTLSVYNLAAQKVATLVDSPISAGTHQAMFDGTGLASGMYFYRFESNNVVKTGKMMLMK